MIDMFADFWTNMPWLVRETISFFIMLIIVRGVIASDITDWLEDRGFIKRREQSIVYHFLDFFYYRFHPSELDTSQTSPSKTVIIEAMKKSFDKWTATARKVAIVQHYSHDHQCESVAECNQGKCGILFTSRA